MNTTELTPGQEVAIGRHATYDIHYSFGWSVKRVTAKGQVVVSKEGMEDRRFNPHGREIGGGNSFSVPFLVTDMVELRTRLNKKARANEAAAALNIISQRERVRNTYSKELMLENVAELEALVAAARAAVEAI